MSARYEHKSDPLTGHREDLTDEAQVALRERVDELFVFAHRYGVRLHLKVRFPEPVPVVPADGLTRWLTPAGKPAIVHFPLSSCIPLGPTATRYTVAVCRVGRERRSFTEDAARVTCPECRDYLAFSARAAP